MLDRLTPKERAVLDRVVHRRTTKEIARDLQIAPNTVDMRVRSARAKLGAQDRNETARIYLELLADCGKTTCGPAVISDHSAYVLRPPPEPATAGTFVLQDSASFELPAPWDIDVPNGLSEVLDSRFGRVWRVAAIPLMALGIALLALALLAIASTLGALI